VVGGAGQHPRRGNVVLLEECGVPSSELQEYLSTTTKLCADRGFATWVNLETFDRDVRIQYPPIAWPKLRFKIEGRAQSRRGQDRHQRVLALPVAALDVQTPRTCCTAATRVARTQK
jgi:hypothetical protein